ncbi:MAG: phosphorelay protein [Alphaproteobacteria bacterium]|nr:phosphorelay protein [Alphaproteobacteria bacterium]
MTSTTPRGKGQVRVRFYRFRNRLKEKAMGLGGSGQLGGFSREALEKAEAEFAKMAEDYPDWVGGYTTQLYAEFSAAEGRDTAHRMASFRGINQLAHELKGQGGTFGYPLITTFAESLYSFTTSGAGTSDNHMAIIKAHIDAINAVIKGRVKGDGGDIGHQLGETLNKAIEKYSVVG